MYHFALPFILPILPLLLFFPFFSVFSAITIDGEWTSTVSLSGTTYQTYDLSMLIYPHGALVDALVVKIPALGWVKTWDGPTLTPGGPPAPIVCTSAALSSEPVEDFVPTCTQYYGVDHTMNYRFTFPEAKPVSLFTSLTLVGSAYGPRQSGTITGIRVHTEADTAVTSVTPPQGITTTTTITALTPDLRDPIGEDTTTQDIKGLVVQMDALPFMFNPETPLAEPWKYRGEKDYAISPRLTYFGDFALSIRLKFLGKADIPQTKANSFIPPTPPIALASELEADPYRTEVPGYIRPGDEIRFSFEFVNGHLGTFGMPTPDWAGMDQATAALNPVPVYILDHLHLAATNEVRGIQVGTGYAYSQVVTPFTIPISLPNGNPAKYRIFFVVQFSKNIQPIAPGDAVWLFFHKTGPHFIMRPMGTNDGELENGNIEAGPIEGVDGRGIAFSDTYPAPGEYFRVDLYREALLQGYESYTGTTGELGGLYNNLGELVGVLPNSHFGNTMPFVSTAVNSHALGNNERRRDLIAFNGSNPVNTLEWSSLPDSTFFGVVPAGLPTLTYSVETEALPPSNNEFYNTIKYTIRAPPHRTSYLVLKRGWIEIPFCVHPTGLPCYDTIASPTVISDPRALFSTCSKGPRQEHTPPPYDPQQEEWGLEPILCEFSNTITDVITAFTPGEVILELSVAVMPLFSQRGGLPQSYEMHIPAPYVRYAMSLRTFDKEIISPVSLYTYPSFVPKSQWPTSAGPYPLTSDFKFTKIGFMIAGPVAQDKVMGEVVSTDIILGWPYGATPNQTDYVDAYLPEGIVVNDFTNMVDGYDTGTDTSVDLQAAASITRLNATHLRITFTEDMSGLSTITSPPVYLRVRLLNTVHTPDGFMAPLTNHLTTTYTHDGVVIFTGRELSHPDLPWKLPMPAFYSLPLTFTLPYAYTIGKLASEVTVLVLGIRFAYPLKQGYYIILDALVTNYQPIDPATPTSILANHDLSCHYSNDGTTKVLRCEPLRELAANTDHFINIPVKNPDSRLPTTPVPLGGRIFNRWNHFNHIASATVSPTSITISTASPFSTVDYRKRTTTTVGYVGDYPFSTFRVYFYQISDMVVSHTSVTPPATCTPLAGADLTTYGAGLECVSTTDVTSFSVDVVFLQLPGPLHATVPFAITGSGLVYGVWTPVVAANVLVSPPTSNLPFASFSYDLSASAPAGDEFSLTIGYAFSGRFAANSLIEFTIPDALTYVILGVITVTSTDGYATYTDCAARPPLDNGLESWSIACKVSFTSWQGVDGTTIDTVSVRGIFARHYAQAASTKRRLRVLEADVLIADSTLSDAGFEIVPTTATTSVVAFSRAIRMLTGYEWTIVLPLSITGLAGDRFKVQYPEHFQFRYIPTAGEVPGHTFGGAVDSCEIRTDVREISCVASSAMVNPFSLIVGGIVNPHLYTPQGGPFVMTWMTSTGAVRATATFTYPDYVPPASIDPSSVTFIDTKTDETTSKTFTVKLPVTLSGGDTLIISQPTGSRAVPSALTWSSTDDITFGPVFPSPCSVTSYMGSDVSYCVASALNFGIVPDSGFPTRVNIGSGTSYEVTMTMQNPTGVPTGDISWIAVSTNGLVAEPNIISNVSYIPVPITTNTVPVVAITPSSMTTYATTQYRFDINLRFPLATGSLIQFTLYPDTAFGSLATSANKIDGMDCPDNPIEPFVVRCTTLVPFSPSSPQPYTSFTLNHVRNPRHVVPQHSVAMNMVIWDELNRLSQERYGLTPFGITQGSFSSISITSNEQRTAATATYTITMTTNGPLENGDTLSLSFPPGTTFVSSPPPALEFVGNDATFSTPTVDAVNRVLTFTLTAAPDQVPSSYAATLTVTNIINSVHPHTGVVGDINHLGADGRLRTQSLSVPHPDVISGSFLDEPLYVTSSNITFTTVSYSISLTLRQDALVGDFLTFQFPPDTIKAAGDVTAQVNGNGDVMVSPCTFTGSPSEPLVTCTVANVNPVSGGGSYFLRKDVLSTVLLSNLVTPRAEQPGFYRMLRVTLGNGVHVKDESTLGSADGFIAGQVRDVLLDPESKVSGVLTDYHILLDLRQAGSNGDTITIDFPFDTRFFTPLTGSVNGDPTAIVDGCLLTGELQVKCTINNVGSSFLNMQRTDLVLSKVYNPPSSSPYANLTLVLRDSIGRLKDYIHTVTSTTITPATFTSAALVPTHTTTKTTTSYRLDFQPTQAVNNGDFFIIEHRLGTDLTNRLSDTPGTSLHYHEDFLPSIRANIDDVAGTGFGGVAFARNTLSTFRWKDVVNPIVSVGQFNNLTVSLYNSRGHLKETTNTMTTPEIIPHTLASVTFDQVSKLTQATTTYEIAVTLHQDMLPNDQFEIHFPPGTSATTALRLQGPIGSTIGTCLRKTENPLLLYCPVLVPGHLMGEKQSITMTLRGVTNPSEEHPQLNDIVFAVTDVYGDRKSLSTMTVFKAIIPGSIGTLTVTPDNPTSGVSTVYSVPIRLRQRFSIGDKFVMTFPDLTTFVTDTPRLLVNSAEPHVSGNWNFDPCTRVGQTFACPVISDTTPYDLGNGTDVTFYFPGIINPPSRDSAVINGAIKLTSSADKTRDASQTVTYAAINADTFPVATLISPDTTTGSYTTYKYTFQLTQRAQTGDIVSMGFHNGTVLAGPPTVTINDVDHGTSTFENCVWETTPTANYRCTLTAAAGPLTGEHAVLVATFDNARLPRTARPVTQTLVLDLYSHLTGNPLLTRNSSVYVSPVIAGSIVSASMLAAIDDLGVPTTYTFEVTLRQALQPTEGLLIQFGPATLFSSPLRMWNGPEGSPQELGTCTVYDETSKRVLCLPSDMTHLAGTSITFKIDNVVNPPRGYVPLNNLNLRHVDASVGVLDETDSMSVNGFLGTGMGEVKLIPRDPATKATTTYDISVNLLGTVHVNESFIITFRNYTTLVDGFTTNVTGAAKEANLVMDPCYKFDRENLTAGYNLTLRCRISSVGDESFLTAGNTVTFEVGPIINSDHPQVPESNWLDAQIITDDVKLYNYCRIEKLHRLVNNTYTVQKCKGMFNPIYHPFFHLSSSSHLATVSSHLIAFTLLSS